MVLCLESSAGHGEGIGAAELRLVRIVQENEFQKEVNDFQKNDFFVGFPLKSLSTYRDKEKRINEAPLGIERSLKRSVLKEMEKQDATNIQNLVDNLSIIPQHKKSKMLEEPNCSSDTANMFDIAEGIPKVHFHED
ncbi:hypothetical protein HNY73_009970 [Argiope bruennichi]|uniref:Uncharacterized protein n=1 Tax=Argiope bruennichi TaxID=94029 RepID=A0A8T0EZN7_ARGBR|nr:hypothetical protein HNY73_009970 [Argiope bruennichi]